MIKKTYCSEIEALLIQFITAFDDCRIIRCDKKSGEYVEILPRWIVAPKTRVLHDITNQAGNITLPVAVVSVKSINLRKEDLFNKHLKQRRTIEDKEYRSKQPVPVTISLTVNFYTKFISDIWQLMSNFASFTNPYIFISWQNPSYLNKSLVEEVRSKVTWDGNFTLNTPQTLSEDQQWILEGSAGFTIEGFLFSPELDKSNIITAVQNYLGNNRYTTQYFTEEGILDYYEKDGWPSVTNIFNSRGYRYHKDNGEIFPVNVNDILTIEGRSFFSNRNTGILINKLDKSEIEGLEYKTFNTIKMGDISGYELPCEIIDDNHITFKWPQIKKDQYTMIIYNKAGYIDMSNIIWK